MIDSAQVSHLGVACLVVVHLLHAALPDHAFDIRNPDVFNPDADGDEHVQTRQRRSARARAHELYVFRLLADDAQTIGDRCADDDRRAVLVIMENRNLHALAQLLLNVEAFRRLDVFEVDAAECGLQRSDVLNELVRIGLVHLDIEAIDTSEFFEQNGFAFHHGLGGQWPNVAKTEHRCSVGHNAHQIAARRHVVRLGRVAHYLFAGERDAR